MSVHSRSDCVFFLGTAFVAKALALCLCIIVVVSYNNQLKCLVSGE